MKKLFVLRHAKATSNFIGQDFDKPLAKRGQTSAPIMAQKIISRGIQSPYVLCSGAQRTRQTLNLMNMELKVKENHIEINDQLYLASAAKLLKEIRKTPNSVNELILLAHNPGVSELVNFLSTETISEMPTNGAACILFDEIHWNEINHKKGKLGYFIYPKMFNK